MARTGRGHAPPGTAHARDRGGPARAFAPRIDFGRGADDAGRRAGAPRAPGPRGAHGRRAGRAIRARHRLWVRLARQRGRAALDRVQPDLERGQVHARQTARSRSAGAAKRAALRSPSATPASASRRSTCRGSRSVSTAWIARARARRAAPGSASRSSSTGSSDTAAGSKSRARKAGDRPSLRAFPHAAFLRARPLQ